MKKFIPKLIDKSLIGLNLDEFFVDADVVLRCHKLFAKMSSETPQYTIDPKTSRMQFEITKDMEDLSYFIPKDEIQNILDNSAERLHRLITPCIEFQIEKGSQHIIPPYFYTDDITSQIFNVNIENITNTIKYFENKKLNLPPIYPAIHLPKNILTNETALRYVISSYTDKNIAPYIKGFYIMIDGLKCDKSDEEELAGYLKLLRSLFGYDVRMVSLDAFGYAGLLIGASTLISGLAQQEYTSINNWSKSTTRGRGQEYTYMPEIFAYLSEIELESINYKCSCNQCNKQLPHTASEKKKHFYHCRVRDLENISDTDFHKGLAKLNNLYSQGLITAKKFITEELTLRKSSDIVSPIKRWLTVLTQAEDIYNLPQAEEELEKLLLELDEHV